MPGASNSTLGEIALVSTNFAPNGWAFCDGASLSIDKYPALFSVIGMIYGGNQTSTFNLPDYSHFEQSMAGTRFVICSAGVLYSQTRRKPLARHLCLPCT